MKWRNLFKSDIGWALLAIVALLVIAAVVSGCAGRWQNPEVYAGTTYNVRDWSAPECNDSKWIGVFGATVPYEYSAGRWEPTYIHNSCLDEEHDASSSDSIGIIHRWRFGDE